MNGSDANTRFTTITSFTTEYINSNGKDIKKNIPISFHSIDLSSLDNLLQDIEIT